MAEYNTRDRSKLFKSGLVDTSDLKDSAVTLDKLAPEVVAEYANKTYVDSAVANVIDSAPGVLDTLNELAAAIGDDANFITTVNDSIDTKLASADFDSTFDTRLTLKDTDDLAEGTNLYYTDARVQTKLANVSGHIIPDTNISYDLGSTTNRFRDLYLSGNTIDLGGTSISTDGSSIIVTDADGDLLNISVQSVTVDGKELSSADILDFNLTIAPEVLEIQVDSTEAGDDVRWFWTWLQSTLPYARATITNSPQLTVPLYKKGTYTLNNFAAYEVHDALTQVHLGYLKWIDGAGTDNVVSWATYVQTTHSHPDINGGATTQVQRFTINVPEAVTPPTLTLPQNIGYDISFTTAGSYTFGANMMHNSVASVASGNNPNIGPLYRGATYTFSLDASIENHPFYFTTDNGQGFVSGGYVGEYTSGVVGSRNNGTSGKETITFTVPSDAPDTLYYQCGVHGSMRGVITVKELAVETNANGNYVLYFQHTHEGHKTPIEIRPIPSLVNQMCLVYDASTSTFVPQDLATYVENTPSFKLKIQEVAGTATLVAPDGTSLVASVKIFSDASYLPFSGNVAGDIAYTEDSNTLFIWNETQYNWVSTKVQNTDELPEGSTNKYYTDARAQASITVDSTLSKTAGEISMPASGVTAGSYGSASTVPVITVDEQGRITSATTTNVAGVSGFSYTAATNTFTITTSAGTSFDATGDLTSFDTGDLTEGSSNLYFTTARAQGAISTSGELLTYNSGVVGLTPEAIQDVVGAMVSSNNESAISVTYNDAGNVLDFAVDTTTIATRTYVDDAISSVINSAPTALDTLNELAAAINDDANYAATVTTALSNKTDKTTTVTAGTGLTGGGDLSTGRTISHADTSSQVSVDNSGNTFIQDITLDGFGHITSIASGSVSVGDGAMTVNTGSGLTGGAQLGTANQSGSTSITISHADTSSQASVNNTGSTFIQDITLDGFGHITGIASGSVSVGDGAMTVTAGSGLTGGGQVGTANQSGASSVTISHADTSSQNSVNNSNGTVIQDITLDGFGHITGLASVDLDGRYYTETEADSRFVNVTGDTMSGPLVISSEGTVLDLTASEGRKISFVLPSSYNSTGYNNLIERINFPWYSEYWDIGVKRGGASDLQDMQWWFSGTTLALSLGRQGNLAVTGTVSTTAASSRLGNLLVGEGPYKNSITPIDDTNLNLNTPSGSVYVTTNIRSPIFYDSDDTGYYVDPNGTSVLNTVYLNGRSGDHAISKVHSGSDFANGTLITTNIDSSGTNGASYILEVTGKSYSTNPAFSFIIQGYIYANTFISNSGTNLSGFGPTNVVTLNYNGNLAFWFPRISYWNSFEARCRNAGGDPVNRVTSIIDSTEPSSSKKVTVAMRTSVTYGMNHNTSGVYATVFYDSDNTGYYVDPSSTSNLNNLTVNGTFNAPGVVRYYEQSSNPGSVNNGSVWYNTATDKTYMRQGGAWVQISPSSSGVGIYDVNGTKVN